MAGELVEPRPPPGSEPHEPKTASGKGHANAARGVSRDRNLRGASVVRPAQKLTELLAARHNGDVFVAQCKSGPSNYALKGELVIMDAWAMRRSWAKPHTFGYEIKVSRGDFRRDQKWTRYLRYCSHFYFVALPGVIDPGELPDDVGLLVASKNLARLFCKREAAHREVTVPESLWRYILMWRASIADPGLAQ